MDVSCHGKRGEQRPVSPLTAGGTSIHAAQQPATETPAVHHGLLGHPPPSISVGSGSQSQVWEVPPPNINRASHQKQSLLRCKRRKARKRLWIPPNQTEMTIICWAKGLQQNLWDVNTKNTQRKKRGPFKKSNYNSSCVMERSPKQKLSVSTEV